MPSRVFGSKRFSLPHQIKPGPGLAGAIHEMRNQVEAAFAQLQNDGPTYLARADWYVDPVAGNDDNSGATSTTAIKTFSELARRWGPGRPLLNPPVRTGNSSTAKVTTIYLMGEAPAEDPFTAALSLGYSTHLVIVGLPGAPLATATIATVTPVTASTNVAASITSSEIADFTPYLGKRCRVTASTTTANVGAIFWIAKAVGANTARISQAGTADVTNAPMSFGNTAGSNVVLTVGDTFVVEELPKLRWGGVGLHAQAGGTVAVTTSSRLGLISIEIAPTDAAGSTRDLVTLVSEGNILSVVKACRFTTQLGHFSGGITPAIGTTGGFDQTASFVNCCFNTALATGMNAKFGSEVLLHSGLSLNGSIAVLVSGTCTMQGHFLSQGGVGTQAPVIVQGTLRVTSMGVCDSPTHGILVGGRKDGLRGQVWAVTGGPAGGGLWGKDNAAYGVATSSGCRFGYTATAPLTLTGTSGDFSLGGANTGRKWDEAAGAGAGAWTAPVTLTWPNLVTNGSLHNVQQDAHALLVEAQV